uniref:EEF1A lysine methyltransferase 3-like n=1 Tax=Pristiophorus japonicus TaxID=55135 RepID=UPI00398EBCB8
MLHDFFIIGFNHEMILRKLLAVEIIRLTNAKTKAIKNVPKPQNVLELRSFLGLLNYFGNFLPKLSSLLETLHMLRRKGDNWVWDQSVIHCRSWGLQGHKSEAETGSPLDPWSEPAWTLEQIMQGQQEKQSSSSSDHKEEVKSLTTRHQFCGYEMRITRDWSRCLGISAVIWQPGIVLCQYFEMEQLNFSGKKVIELGSGTGIVGILATLLGGDVTLTDQPIVLHQIEYNIASNIPSDIIQRSKVSALSWGKDQEQFPTDYDIILGSDIVYQPCEALPLIKTLQYLSNHKTVIYLSSRMYEPMGALEFHEKLIPLHFNSEIIHRVPKQEINIYRITKRGPEAQWEGGEKNNEGL